MNRIPRDEKNQMFFADEVAPTLDFTAEEHDESWSYVLTIPAGAEVAHKTDREILELVENILNLPARGYPPGHHGETFANEAIVIREDGAVVIRNTGGCDTDETDHPHLL